MKLFFALILTVAAGLTWRKVNAPEPVTDPVQTDDLSRKEILTGADQTEK